MKAHIVCRDFETEKILPRHARILADGTGWTLSARPEPGNDINYYFCYIEYSELFSDWHATRTAAYFTHYEDFTPFKRFFWEQAAAQVNYRVCSSDKYALLLPKPVVKARPPIEPIFNIQERKPNALPRIGVSGFLDRSGRKGPDLVAKLAGDMSGRAEIAATGAGWPVPTRSHTLAQLPGWYNSLDLYLCSSTTEGIPMPPLEALACGIPVVIPRGVGIMDELVSHPGIYRFKAGDYADMKAAVVRALDELGRHDRQSLRAVVAEYTPANWVRDTLDGLEAVMRGDAAPVPTKEIDRHGQRGVYYVAYGTPARECAEGAIKSFKEHLPGVPVALVSSEPLGPEDIFIEYPDNDIGGRDAKTMIYELAPREWQYILYLDADTEVVADISFLYQVLEDGWDMLICRNPAKYHTARMMVRPDNKDECEETFKKIGTDEVLQLNGGVFAFQRNERTRAFITAWHNEWKRYGKRDQGALLRALFDHPVKLYVLGNEWNTITRYQSPDESAGILHYPMTARRWRGVVHARSDDPQAWKLVEAFEKEHAK